MMMSLFKRLYGKAEGKTANGKGHAAQRLLPEYLVTTADFL
jgi:hypothetical protein